MAHGMTEARFSRALKSARIPDTIEAGEQLISEARALRSAQMLNNLTLRNTRSLVAVLRSPYAGFMPAEDAQKLLTLYGRMADVALEVGLAGAFEPYAIQAELALQSGDAKRAVELQQRALAAVSSYRKDEEQKRADEYAEAAEQEERREQRRGRPQPDPQAAS